jgi:YidC/Oxa1 family membrane protein insertase
MEQVRLIIAIAASILVFVVWEFFFADKQIAPITEQKAAIEHSVKDSNSVQSASEISEKKSISAPNAENLKPAKLIRVETPLYSAVLSEKGAVLKSFILKNYKETIKKDSAFKELIPQDTYMENLKISFKDGSISELNDAVFLADTQLNSINAVYDPKSLSFYFKSSDGITIKKEYVFSPDTYIVDIITTIQNKSDKLIKDELILSLFGKVSEKRSYDFEGPSGFINGEENEVKIKSLDKQNLFLGNIKWIALQDIYFITSIINENNESASMRIFNSNNIVENQYISPIAAIAPGQIKEFKNKIYFGPKSITILEKTGYDLNRAVDFGMFDFIAKPCVKFMNFIYGIIPNYGVAIIILTILIKILFWPLGAKSYKSMNEMKKVQPLMAEIRAKYKDDKQKINAEVMKLYKTYKINPLSGCLPMIVQLPIFFALYRMLYGVIELRHAPFFGWITDLSAPDRLFNFGFSIPFMQPPYGIPVFTIIMGASMFVQQRMSPPPGDPSQAKIMLFMPIVFTFIFINFSSGLVLYWLVNNVFSIAQQHYTNKRLS